MQSELDQKRTLFKEQILDKQYDKEKFIQFLQAKKSGGEDLSLWTYDELREIIEEFKKVEE